MWICLAAHEGHSSDPNILWFSNDQGCEDDGFGFVAMSTYGSSYFDLWISLSLFGKTDRTLFMKCKKDGTHDGFDGKLSEISL